MNVMFISGIVTRGDMATSKTSSFWLTETVTLTSGAADGSRFSGTMDLGAYVDVGDQQAISVESVDGIWQRATDFGNDAESFLATAGSLGYQLTDLNPNDLFVRADDNNLIASGAINISAGVVSHSNDFFPDIFGKLDEARTVVNDQMYVVAGNDGALTGSSTMYLTVRVKCRIVKLSTKDWMAIAIQSTAADN